MTSFRIIYVPGMKPKPAPEAHRRELMRALDFGLRAVRPEAAELLAALPERFELVAWTYSFYGRHRDIELDMPGIEALYAQPEPTAAERSQIDGLKRRLLRWWHVAGDSVPILSRLLARPALRETLDEVGRYRDDVDGVGTQSRSMLKQALVRSWERDERVLLIGHSLGSVICYDALWELSRREHVAGRVDVFATLGSPLATRFIRTRLRGAGCTGAERFPANIGRWANFSARGELTALHPRLKPYFGGIVEVGLAERLEDHTDLYNPFRADFGMNVHKSYGYLANRKVAECLGDWLLE